MGFLSEKRQFLADRFTPAFLMSLCDGLTDIQSQDALRPFIGEWIRVAGNLEHATPNPTFGAAGVTIVFPGERRRDAFLWFERDLDSLAKVGRGERVTIEGRIKSISEHSMVLESCGLANPQLVSILEVTAAAEELGKAAEDWSASPQKLAVIEPPSEPRPSAPNADKRKNLAPAEMEKFCKLLLEGWPSTTERVAHPKAIAFFPENKVPVKAFLEIFRAIRGHRNPGPQPKNKN